MLGLKYILLTETNVKSIFWIETKGLYLPSFDAPPGFWLVLPFLSITFLLSVFEVDCFLSSSSSSSSSSLSFDSSESSGFLLWTLPPGVFCPGVCDFGVLAPPIQKRRTLKYYFRHKNK